MIKIIQLITIQTIVYIFTIGYTEIAVGAQDIIQKDMAELKNLAYGATATKEVVITDEIIQKLKQKKSYLFDHMNSYKHFRDGLMRVIKLENFMSFFDRVGDCCSAATGIKKPLSGYYEGQWKLLDSSPGL